jgi:hypothetical protein
VTVRVEFLSYQGVHNSRLQSLLDFSNVCVAKNIYNVHTYPLVIVVFRCVCKIVKSDYELHHVCLPVCLSVHVSVCKENSAVHLITID